MNFIFQLMRQFTIHFRMLSAIVVVLGFLGLLGGAGVYGMFRIQGLSENLVEPSFVSAQRLGNLRYEMSLLRQHEKNMIIQHDKSMLVKQTREKWLAGTQKVDEAMKQLFESISEMDRPNFNRAIQHVRAYRDSFSPVARQLEEGGYETVEVASRMSEKAIAGFEEADKVLSQIDTALREEAHATVVQQALVLRQTLLLFAGLVVLTVIVVAPLTLFNMQAICRPVKQARELAQAIAQGDLSQQMKAQGRDEVADLQCALDEMRNCLGTMVAQVRDSSESIATASHEIASGNHDLSGRTEQTASNVQKTVSSITNLSHNVQQTASSAQTANELAISASRAALKGGSVVEQAVHSMQSISAASHKINDIIGLIDSIAFQTNILSLNAAVEAARAGEQGRGFAVVASEVRSLAQRSAKAASEIKVLVNNNVMAVDGGVRLVEEAGSAMKEIVNGVKRVSDIIGEITVAAAEQSEGIDNVSQSVNEIDQMTQQNAALVEQSAAAAESMQGQADRLAQVVRQFRLESSTQMFLT